MHLSKLLAVGALASGLMSGRAVAQAGLELTVFTSSPAGFLANSTLVSGAKHAILIDAQFTRADAHRLVAMIIERNKTLTTVYITHDHPDHYFGLEVIRQAFPAVRFVALPGAISAIRQTRKAKVAQWKPLYGHAITAMPLVPSPLLGHTITLDGESLEVVGPVQGDDAYNSFVWIPSLRAVVAGDIVYSGVHVWTAETNVASRTAWAATIDRISALNPAIVVPGHQTPELGTSAASLAFTKEYLAVFDGAVASSGEADEVQGKVKSRYPGLALDVILTIGAQAQFKSAAR